MKWISTTPVSRDQATVFITRLGSILSTGTEKEILKKQKPEAIIKRAFVPFMFVWKIYSIHDTTIASVLGDNYSLINIDYSRSWEDFRHADHHLVLDGTEEELMKILLSATGWLADMEFVELKLSKWKMTKLYIWTAWRTLRKFYRKEK